MRESGKGDERERRCTVVPGREGTRGDGLDSGLESSIS
jgi:hypothetical protein